MTTEVRFVLDDEMAAALQKRAKMDFSTRTSVVKKALAEYLFSEKTPIKSSSVVAPEASEALVRTAADERKYAQLACFKEEKDKLLVDGELIRPLRVFAMFYIYDRNRPASAGQQALVTRHWVDFCSNWITGVSKLEAKYGIKPGTRGGYGILIGGNPNPDWDVFSSDRIAKLAEEYRYLADEQCDEAVALENLLKDFYSDPAHWKDGKYV